MHTPEIVDESMKITKYTAGRPMAAHLFWFFGCFICGVWLCFVILVRYKIEYRLK